MLVFSSCQHLDQEVPRSLQRLACLARIFLRVGIDMIFLFYDLIKISEFGEILFLTIEVRIEEKNWKCEKRGERGVGCMYSLFHPFTIPLSSIFSLYLTLQSNSKHFDDFPSITYTSKQPISLSASFVESIRKYRLEIPIICTNQGISNLNSFNTLTSPQCQLQESECSEAYRYCSARQRQLRCLSP